MIKDKHGKYFRAGGVKKVPAAPRFLVGLQQREEAAADTWVEEKDLVSTTESARDYPSIWFGFFGAVFKSTGGDHLARVVAPVFEAGSVRQLQVRLWKTGGDEQKAAVLQLDVARFLEKFPQTAAAAGVEWAAADRRPPAVEMPRLGGDQLKKGDLPHVFGCLAVTYWSGTAVKTVLELDEARAFAAAALDGLVDIPATADAAAVLAALAALETLLRGDAPAFAALRGALKETVQLMGAAAVRGDAGRSGALLRVEAGELLRSMPPVASTPAAASPAASGPVGGKRPRTEEGATEDGGSDDETDDSDDSDDVVAAGDEGAWAPEGVATPPARAAAGAKRARPPADSDGETSASEDEEAEAKRQKRTVGFAETPGETSAKAALRSITPKTMTPIAAVRLFFRGAALLRAAGVDELSADIDESDELEVAGVRFRYGKAVARLAARVGDFAGDTRPASSLALVALREDVFDRVVALETSGREHAPGADATGDAKTGKKTEGLARGDRSAAVPYAVAAALRGGSPDLEAALRGRSVSDGVQRAPESLREELSRALLSNGKVHAPGEQQSLAHLPPVVSAARESLETEVSAQLRQAADGDITQRWQLPRATAIGLAVGLIEGSARLTDFQKANAAMRSSDAAAEGTLQELQQAWALAKRGLDAVSRTVLGGFGAEALQRVSDAVDPSAQSTKVAVSDVRLWLERIFQSWEEQLYTFRQLGSPANRPTIAAAVDKNSPFMSFAVSTAAVVASASSRLALAGVGGGGDAAENDGRSDRVPPKPPRDKKKRRQRDTPDKKDPDERGNTTRAKEKKEQAARKGESGLDRCWPAEQRAGLQGNEAAWRQATGLFKSAYPGHCVFWALYGSGCRRGTACARKHEVPPDMKSKVIDKVKLE